MTEQSGSEVFATAGEMLRRSFAQESVTGIVELEDLVKNANINAGSMAEKARCGEMPRARKSKGKTMMP